MIANLYDETFSELSELSDLREKREPNDHLQSQVRIDSFKLINPHVPLSSICSHGPPQNVKVHEFRMSAGKSMNLRLDKTASWLTSADPTQMSSTSTVPLKLWYSPGACSFVPHVALCEAGLEAELILAQVGKMSDEFKALNPKARVPVLAIGVEVITEMSAVLTAIASLAPEAHLLGHSAMETIRVYEWLNYLSTTAHAQSFASVWRTERFTRDPEVYPSIQARGVENVRDVYAFVERKLSDHESDYAVGNSFTVVDPFLVLMYCWAGRLRIEMERAYPRYTSYVQGLLGRPSVVEARKVHSHV